MNEFLNIIKGRRSIYSISNQFVISDEKITQILEDGINHTPSAFNSQTSRVVLTIGEKHNRVWEIVLNQLKKQVPEDKFEKTRQKIASFSAGYGTILFFEEQETVKSLQKNFPLYSDNFPLWSLQSSGMLQFVVWTALESEGFGASLQHYNPLIDEDIAKEFSLPSSWKLLAQLPFGYPLAKADEKSFLPIEQRLKVFK